ncbi:LysR substrate-binding domain-containing protein [Kineosporia succinea]|uniref:DNA-binding transcriptional LysR family regulator n=1 Tax=Kineosporia succinea TaxID=84632 RepID=A0ABT9P0I3_9ACTN|nr:LysR substrate-binding domain-containing protein [Kineosporia succinea]MDP9826180.1 DNA-binding transcriptional LysR family regulator [Kineosporia succinea]
METRRLELLLELSRLGSMREVAGALGTTTSTVSQQIAVLAREVGTPLLEPHGRRVRLTPAGKRLATHAVTVLAAVEAARADLDPSAEPTGTLRAGAFATAIRRALLPILARPADSHPGVRLLVHELEPAEALAALGADDIDLALVYDYDLAPRAKDPSLHWVPLWTTPWAIGAPAHRADARRGRSAQTLAALAGESWIVNSRNTADEDVVRTLAATAGFEPRVDHRADSLDLVEDLILAGPGVGLLPAGRPVRPGIVLLPLHDPGVRLRAHAVTRAGRAEWPPLAAILDLLLSGQKPQ